jgi:hemolysin III
MNASESQQELANAITHGFGLLLGLFAVPALLIDKYEVADSQLWWGLAIFGCSLLLVYTTSTLYHSVAQPRIKHSLRIADHISIYLLIAGTHTPFLLYYLPGSYYLIIIWSLVVIGTFYKLFFFDRWEWLSIVLYLGMGWMGVLTVPYMMEVMPEATLNGIVIGGVSYTIGVVFYAWRKLPYHHAIWHLFVIGGTAAHFWAIWAMLR